MDWTAFAIGAIPSVLALLTFLLQLRRDKAKEQALTSKTRAESMTELALGEKTRIEATVKIVTLYESIIDRLEAELEDYRSQSQST